MTSNAGSDRHRDSRSDHRMLLLAIAEYCLPPGGTARRGAMHFVTGISSIGWQQPETGTEDLVKC